MRSTSPARQDGPSRFIPVRDKGSRGVHCPCCLEEGCTATSMKPRSREGSHGAHTSPSQQKVRGSGSELGGSHPRNKSPTLICWVDLFPPALDKSHTPKNTGVVAMPSSRGSFQPRDQTQVKHMNFEPHFVTYVKINPNHLGLNIKSQTRTYRRKHRRKFCNLELIKAFQT